MTYPLEVRQRALLLLEQGCSAAGIGKVLGVDRWTVRHWARLAGMKFQVGARGGLRHSHGQMSANSKLGFGERSKIELLLSHGRSIRQIATQLGVAPSTVSRENKKGLDKHGQGGYLAWRAEAVTDRRRARPKPLKLEMNLAFRGEVVKRLRQKHSPRQISRRLAKQFPNCPEMLISHETIYQALYIQSRGTLRHELGVEKALRSGRSSRKPQSKLPAKDSRRPWTEGANISLRPAEVEDRAIPGNWEGDLVLGKANKSAVISLVERVTRFAMLYHLPDTHDSATVVDALKIMANQIPQALRRSITWDQGPEMAKVADFKLANPGFEVFFCDPHSPWQRGTNENFNGLLPQYFPKGTDFTRVGQEELQQTQDELNSRPRQTLDWDTPAEHLNKYLQTVATTT